MARKQKSTDNEISIMLKNKLVQMVCHCKDPASVVALTTAYAKLRAVELKQDEGDWGNDISGDESAPVSLRMPQQ